jgi:transposase
MVSIERAMSSFAADSSGAILAFFQKLPPCLIGIEACASSHHWSRELQALGHTVVATGVREAACKTA